MSQQDTDRARQPSPAEQRLEEQSAAVQKWAEDSARPAPFDPEGRKVKDDLPPRKTLQHEIPPEPLGQMFPRPLPECPPYPDHNCPACTRGERMVVSSANRPASSPLPNRLARIPPRPIHTPSGQVCLKYVNAETATAAMESIEQIRTLYAAAREQARSIISRMHLPTTALSDAQRTLEARSGTPRAFADGLVDAIGEISLEEAQAAIRRYEDEWNAASGTTEAINGILKGS